MFITFLLTLFLGIVLGALLFTILSLYFFKIKCPQCKKLKLIKEIMVLNLKTRTITGQACQQCQRPKPQVSLEL